MQVPQVLKDWYPDEYEMLKYLSQGDLDSFNEFAHDNINFTKHLVGYGLIQKSRNGYSFNMEIVKEYLGNQYKYERINPTNEEMLKEVSLRRNAIEKSLRKIIKKALKMKYGKQSSLQKVLSALNENRRKALNSIDVDEILSADNSPLFFLELVGIINREWDDFKNIFDIDKNKALVILEDINKGRPDAHAKKIEKNDFDQLRLHFNKLEQILAEWE